MIVGKVLLYVVLFILMLVTIYSLNSIIVEFKRRRYINDFINNINKKYQSRQKEREKKYLYEGYTSDIKFIDKVDNSIEKASLRVLFPFLTSEMLIVITILLGIIAAYISNKIYHFWLYTLGAFFLVILVITLLLKYMARHTFNKIDDQLLIYINTLINLCGSNDDIVAIINKSIPYVNSPLKEYSQQFVFECQKGIDLQKAFKNFEDKVESRRFKQLLKNLQICSKHESNYKIILNKSRRIMKNYFEEKERRKKSVKRGRIVILGTLIMGFFLFQISTSFSDGLMEALKNSLIGNFILGYLLILVLYGVYKFIALDKINY